MQAFCGHSNIGVEAYLSAKFVLLNGGVVNDGEGASEERYNLTLVNCTMRQR